MKAVSRRRIMTVVAIAVALAAAVMVVGTWVTPSRDPSPALAPAQTSEPVPSSSPSGEAAPPPPQFPDQGELTDVSGDHEVPNFYPLATFTSPAGLQCAMWSNRGSTAASCFGEIPGLDHPASHVYADEYGAYFDQSSSPADDRLNGRLLAPGRKVILGASGKLMGGDQITCSISMQGDVVACILVRGFDANHGDATAQRHGFVVGPDKSWTF